MDRRQEPRQVFFAYLSSQVDELECRARDLAREFLDERERLRKQVPGRRALGLYIFVSRDQRTLRLSVEWRRARYVDNVQIARKNRSRDFAKTQHVHRCPRPDFAYTAGNLAVATRGGEQWEKQLVSGYEKRAVVLRRHSALLAELQSQVATLDSVASLRY